MRTILASLVLAFSVFAAAAGADWRPATESELQAVIPARAAVEKERIETESRTASGITDGRGKFIAGVVLITAGYSADGKYSHWLVTQVPLHVGGLALRPGEYVFGTKKSVDSLSIRFFEAQTGKPVGTVDAPRTSRVGRIESFRIYAAADKHAIQIGRFAVPYTIE